VHDEIYKTCIHMCIYTDNTCLHIESIQDLAARLLGPPGDYIHILIYKYIHEFIYTYIYLYKYIIHVYIYIHMYIYIHAYVYIYFT
jgi:hypothetical protein